MVLAGAEERSDYSFAVPWSHDFFTLFLYLCTNK